MTAEITPEIVQEVVDYLNDPESRRGTWAGLLFMEANGFDWAMRAHELHDTLINELRSPLTLYGGLNPKQERALVFALRQRARTELGLTPLRNKDIRSWTYSMIDQKERRRSSGESQTPADTYLSTEIERAELRVRIAELDPELSRALAAFAAHNGKVPHTAALSTLWMRPRLTALVLQIKPALTGLDAHEFVNRLLDDERERYR